MDVVGGGGEVIGVDGDGVEGGGVEVWRCGGVEVRMGTCVHVYMCTCVRVYMCTGAGEVMCVGGGVYTYMYMNMISFRHGMGREWSEVDRPPPHAYRRTGWKGMALEGDTAEGTQNTRTTQGQDKRKTEGK